MTVKSRSIGALEHWEHWSIGALEHWSIGALEHCSNRNINKNKKTSKRKAK